MMKRILELRIPLYAVLHEDRIIKPADKAQFDISDEFWKTIEDMVPVLEPFAKVTEMLSKEDIPTASSIAVLLPTLLTGLKADATDSPTIREVRKTMFKSFIQRFQLDENGEPITESLQSVTTTATFLDPRYKVLKFFTPRQREVTQDKVIELMDNMHQPPPVIAPPAAVKTESEEDIVLPPKRLLLECLKGDIVDLTTSGPTSSELELERYISERVSTPYPLVW